MSALLAASACGCSEIIPRDDLRAAARSFPPAESVSQQQVGEMAEVIRMHTGVHDFAFSDSIFTPETRLPSGTQWIMGVMIGE